MLTLEDVQKESAIPDIRILGVGGAGIHVVQQVVHEDVPFHFIMLDSNKSCMSEMLMGHGLALGESINPSGLGAGGNAELGRGFALASEDQISEALEGADMVFLVAGLGGGVGSGAVPVITRIANDLSIPVITFVTEPFPFEGGQRIKNSDEALADLEELKTALIVLSNSQLLSTTDANMRLVDALAKSSNLLAKIICRILSLCSSVGMINLDFSDLCTLISHHGHLFVGEGESVGKRYSIEDAYAQSIENPLLTTGCITLQKAACVLAYLETGPEFNLGELDILGGHIRELVLPSAEVMIGITIVPEWSQQVRVTLLAVGLKEADNLPKIVESSASRVTFLHKI